MISVNIPSIASSLSLTGDGIWVSPSIQAISYPSDGNTACMQIEENSWWFKHRNGCLSSVLKLFPPSGTIFDIGGGNGFVSRGIQESGFEAIVVEPGLAGAHNARARGVKSVICSTLQDAKFADQSLPAVGLFDVLEHIEDDLGFLRILSDKVMSAGRLYLTVPAYSLLWSSEDDYAEHYRRYTLSSLHNVLTQASFELEFATYIFSFLPLPIFVARTLPSLLGLRTTSELETNLREHSPPSSDGFGHKLLGRLLNFEISRLERGSTIPFGGSCLVVARRS